MGWAKYMEDDREIVTERWREWEAERGSLIEHTRKSKGDEEYTKVRNLYSRYCYLEKKVIQ